MAVYHNLKSAIREKYRKGATNVSDGTGLHLTSWRTHGPWPGGVCGHPQGPTQDPPWDPKTAVSGTQCLLQFNHAGPQTALIKEAGNPA